MMTRRNSIRAALIAAVFVFMLSACRTSEGVSPPFVKIDVRHDTVQATDTVWRDRVRTVFVKGDTVYKIDSVWQYRIKVNERVVYRDRTDTVPVRVEVEVPVPVPRQRSGYDRFTSWGFWILAVGFLFSVALWFLKWYIKVRR